MSVIGVLQDDTFRPFTELDAHQVEGKLAKDPEQVRKALKKKDRYRRRGSVSKGASRAPRRASSLGNASPHTAARLS